jgi:hypothetical protein
VPLEPVEVGRRPARRRGKAEVDGFADAETHRAVAGEIVRRRQRSLRDRRRGVTRVPADHGAAILGLGAEVVGLSMRHDADLRGRDAEPDQLRLHGLRALARQCPVRTVLAILAGKTMHQDRVVAAVVAPALEEFSEDRLLRRGQAGLIDVEHDIGAGLLLTLLGVGRAGNIGRDFVRVSGALQGVGTAHDVAHIGCASEPPPMFGRRLPRNYRGP